MAQPQPPNQYPKNEMPPPPYPGEPTLNYPHHEQVPVQPGWGSMPPPPPPYQYQYGATSTTTVTIQPGGGRSTIYTTGQPIQQPMTRIVVVGNGCPSCRVGMLVDSYDCFAIFLAIFFFPLGILCCLAMRQKRCTNCGGIF